MHRNPSLIQAMCHFLNEINFFYYALLQRVLHNLKKLFKFRATLSVIYIPYVQWGNVIQACILLSSLLLLITCSQTYCQWSSGSPYKVVITRITEIKIVSHRTTQLMLFRSLNSCIA